MYPDALHLLEHQFDQRSQPAQYQAQQAKVNELRLQHDLRV